MYYVFEDNEQDIISKFIVSGYNNTDKFIFAKGNGNLVEIVKSLLESSDERIAVFMDTIPGNKPIVGIYNKLRRISIKNNYRVVVFNLVCMEYYLIKSMYGTQVIEDNTGIDICINREVYFESPVLTTEVDKKMARNFEKYCKLIMIKNLKDCARHSGKDTCTRYGYY